MKIIRNGDFCQLLLLLIGMDGDNQHDIAIIGAGAAGLMAAIWAGRNAPGCRVVALDGARKLGAKILIAGGGRCNVTHEHVSEGDYAGSSHPAIRKILRRFEAPQTVAFFREIGVELKREESGKLFPVDDSARSVLAALLAAARQAGVTILHPRRVERVTRQPGGFCLAGEWGCLHTRALILAPGGRSLPKSGSDGHGYVLAQSLGHSLTPHIFPGLTPLTLPSNHFICSLSGVTTPAALTLWSSSGRRLRAFTGSTLCAHFGLSGPAVLDMSRYYIEARQRDPGASLTINWLPEMTPSVFEQNLLTWGPATALAYLRGRLPERLARALCAAADVGVGVPAQQLTRSQRKNLTALATQLRLPITGNRGYNYAEVTAGGVPLAELHLTSMASRVCPNLYLCGEICDVDGRIGGFNFQWAWSSGYVAGISAAAHHLASA